MEEAGARGRLGRTLGTFADPDRRHRTTVFVLHVDPENGGLVDDFEEKVIYPYLNEENLMRSRSVKFIKLYLGGLSILTIFS